MQKASAFLRFERITFLYSASSHIAKSSRVTSLIRKQAIPTAIWAPAKRWQEPISGHIRENKAKNVPKWGKTESRFRFQAFNPDDFDQLAEQAANFEQYFINAKHTELVSLPGYSQIVEGKDDN